MDAAILQRINREVYRRYPEFEGKKPRLQRQTASRKNNDGSIATYLLVYQTRVKTADEKWMPRYVRVTVTEEGKILKMATSR